MSIPEAVATNTDRLERAVGLDAADYYVHVGEGTDDVLRYLTRVDGEDKRYAYVFSGDRSTLCVAPRYVAEANERFPGDEIREIDPGNGVTDEVRAVVGDGASVTVPETTAVGVVSELETFAEVAVVDEPDAVWCVKSEAEQRILAHVAEGVQHGVARAETVLARASVEGDRVVWDGEELTTERLRRQIQKALADYGLSDEGNVIVGAGGTCTDLHFTGNDVVDPGDTVLIDLGPRGPLGYYGDITRTFVVGEPDDWALEAYRIVEEALEAAFCVLDGGAGTPVRDLYGAMADVVESYGYGTGLHETRDDAVGLYHGTGHGIGVRIHERPFQTADSTERLEEGTVLTVEPGLYDPGTAGVRLEDVVVVTGDGYENFMTYPRSIVPEERASPPAFLE